jgi:hypothetical protein
MWVGIRGFFGLLCLVVAGCETISAHSDYDRSNDFSRYGTFAFISDRPLVSAPPEVNPLLEGHIVRAVTASLSAKGMRLVGDPAKADFVVAFTLGAREKVQVTSTPYPAGFRGPYGWGMGYYNDVDVRQYTEGRLAIDVFDMTSKRPVWHGYATKSVTSGDRANPQPLIQKAVDAILADFPPGRDGKL